MKLEIVGRNFLTDKSRRPVVVAVQEPQIITLTKTSTKAEIPNQILRKGGNLDHQAIT